MTSPVFPPMVDIMGYGSELTFILVCVHKHKNKEGFIIRAAKDLKIFQGFFRGEEKKRRTMDGADWLPGWAHLSRKRQGKTASIIFVEVLTVPKQKMCLETQTISCSHLFSLLHFTLNGSFYNCEKIV